MAEAHPLAEAADIAAAIAAAKAEERADVLVWLESKINGASTAELKKPEHAGDIAAMRRAWQVLQGDLLAGLHEGAAMPAASDNVEG